MTFSEWISSVWLRMKTLTRRRQLDRDLQDEIAFHLSMREEKLKSNIHREEGRMGGRQQSNDEHFAARRGFGNTTHVKEETRSLWTFHWFEHLGQDLRYAARSMRKSPAVAAVVVLSLALGMGANTAIFTLMDAVMLRMLPVQHPEELVVVKRQIADSPRRPVSFTNPMWEALRAHQDVFAPAFAWSTDRYDLAHGGPVQNAEGNIVSGSYFAALGVRPALGRLINEHDDRRGCAPVAVLSYGFWQDRFGGSQNILGSSITLDQKPFQIIGVAERGFSGIEVGSKFDVALPICATTQFDGAPQHSRLDHRSWWWLRIGGRLKPGVSQLAASERLSVLSPAILADALPQDWATKDQQRFLKAKLVSEAADTGVSDLRRQFGEPLTIVMAIVSIVLLIACANIASLLLARATARNREIAIRKAVGASRGRLMRQLLTEALLLSAIGALLGMFVARWGSVLLLRSIATSRDTLFLDLAPDLRVLGFTAGLALLTGLLVGVLPALRSTAVPLMAAMKGAQEAAGGHSSRFRAGKWIVAGQVALSLVLVVGGGLLLRSFYKLVTLDLGFDRNNVLLVRASLQTDDNAKKEAIYEQVEERIKAIPGVVAAGRSFTTPVNGRQWNNLIHPEGEANPPTGDQAISYLNAISPGYFDVMRMPMIAGREFNANDSKTSPLVAIVTETFATRFYPGQNALGREFRIDASPGQPEPLMEIVGIVADSKYGEVREEPTPIAFVPALQPHRSIIAQEFAIRTNFRPSALTASVAQAFAAVNAQTMLDFGILSQQVDDNFVQERLLAELSGFFGGLALLLAMIGLYGVLSYLVTQRRTEFGIRMALGARPQSILRLVILDSLAVLAGGVAVGVGLSLATSRLLQKMLFGLSPHDVTTMLIAVGVLITVGMIAAFLPARKATRVDPMVALRYE